MHGLRAGGGIHLPAGGEAGRRTRQKAAPGVDRFPDRGGDPPGHPGGEGPFRLRQSVRRRLPAGEGGLPDGHQLLPRPHPEIRYSREKLSEAGPGRHLRGPGHDLRAWHGGQPGAGDPPVCQNPLLPGDGIPRPGRAAFRRRADFRRRAAFRRRTTDLRGRVAGGGGLRLVSVAASLQGKRLPEKGKRAGADRFSEDR